MYAAGTDTTVSSLMSFFVAALLHPEIQIRAQEEIDAVTGRERLPTFEDRQRLPFVDAICKEVLRWRPVVPLAIPHAATEDNVYRGFFIPKGALVIGNSWCDTCRISPSWHQLFLGQSCMTRPITQTQMRSNQNGSSIQMEPCVMIQS